MEKNNKNIPKIIYCTNCGEKLLENAAFCANCGADIQYLSRLRFLYHPRAIYGPLFIIFSGLLLLGEFKIFLDMRANFPNSCGDSEFITQIMSGMLVFPLFAFALALDKSKKRAIIGLLIFIINIIVFWILDSYYMAHFSYCYF